MAKIKGFVLFILTFTLLPAFSGLSFVGITSTTTFPVISISSIAASGLNYPVGIYHAGDQTGRIFIVEQTGKIKILKNGTILPTPFIDLSSLLISGGERGLLGLAFHPRFTENGYFYLNYTRQPDGESVIARYQVSSNPDIADFSSGLIVLTIGQPFANHNGGHLAFGKDGYLYIGMGDGGSGGDPNNYALNLNSLLGKMLRIDIDRQSQGKQYSIPPGNFKDEIWALGLRNPWFWSFDRLNGDLYIADVGQNNWEEVNYIRFSNLPGANLGWSCLEGTHIYNLNRYPCNDALYVAETIEPIAEYSHAVGQSITGGYVYRGKKFPNLTGMYFYGDFPTGKLWSFRKTSSNPDGFSAPQLHLDTDMLISCFGEDEEGEIYLCDYTGGQIRKLEDISATPIISDSSLVSNPIYANQGESVTYTLSLKNTGGNSSSPITAEIIVPSGLQYLSSTSPLDDSNAPVLVWQGVLPLDTTVEVNYTVRVDISKGNPLTNVNLSGLDFPFTTLQHVLLIPRPSLQTTSIDFFFPGTQPGNLVDPVMLPTTCDVCHTDAIYKSWQGSMMSQSGRDPLFWAALEVANYDAPGSGEYCLRCHTPKGWLEGRSVAEDGSLLTPADYDSGVSCEICHRAVNSIASNNATDQAKSRDEMVRNGIVPALPPDHVGSSMMIVDPEDFRRGPYDLGVNFQYHPNLTYRSDFLGGNPNDPITRSRLCGTCHNVDNPILSLNQAENEYLPNTNNLPAPAFTDGSLFAVETTYDEWLYSGFSTSTACQDCHMPRATGYAAESFFNPVFRDCGVNGCLPIHEFIGGNTWIPQLLQDTRWRLNRQDLSSLLTKTAQRSRQMLQQAAQVKLDFNPNSNQVAIRVTNLTGHKLPTGYAEGRRMWLGVVAYDSLGNEVFSTCNFDLKTGILTEDQNCTVFEIKQAITTQMASSLNGTIDAGPGFHFLLNNSVYKDNRLPPDGFSAEALNKKGLMPMENGQPSNLYVPGQNYLDIAYNLPITTVSVVAYLYYQTVSKEYIDFLSANGGVDSNTLTNLWKENKNIPELMAWDSFPFYSSYFPLIIYYP